MSKGIKNNLVIQKLLSVTLVIGWMITVFIFSNQDGEETHNTSSNFIHAIDFTISTNKNSLVESSNDIITDTEDILENKEYKYKYSDKIQKIVRKNAHYFLYMFGGINLSVFFCVISKKSNIKENEIEKGIMIRSKLLFSKCIFYAIITGIIYAITDELHQKIIPGRTCSFIDVLIDSFGIITGVIIIYLFNLIIKKFNVKWRNNNVSVKRSK